jgi:hypothetical protein
MKYFEEVTEWDSPTAVNHIYYLNEDKSKMVGYIKHGTKDLFKFKQPISFYGKGRKFIELKTKGEPDSVYFTKSEAFAPKQAIEVEGSNGKKYYVTKVGAKYMCTCPGFTFRHTCKHTNEIKEKNEQANIKGDSITSGR